MKSQRSCTDTTAGICLDDKYYTKCILIANMCKTVKASAVYHSMSAAAAHVLLAHGEQTDGSAHPDSISHIGSTTTHTHTRAHQDTPASPAFAI